MAGECAVHVEVQRNTERRLTAVEADAERQWAAIDTLRAVVNKAVGIGILAGLLMPILTGLATAYIIRGMK